MDGKPNPYWTIGGGALVLWNATMWHHPKYHLSRLARQHPVVAGGIMAAYTYHFFLQGRCKTL